MLWWRIGQSEKVSLLQLFSKSRDTFPSPDGLRVLVPFCGTATVKLCISMDLFGLVEETERQPTCVRSLCLIKVDMGVG